MTVGFARPLSFVTPVTVAGTIASAAAISEEVTPVIGCNCCTTHPPIHGHS